MATDTAATSGLPHSSNNAPIIAHNDANTTQHQGGNVDRNENHQLIRGVNIGGWLVLERYITPYQFAVTECHLDGDFCWYAGQLSAPSFVNDENSDDNKNNNNNVLGYQQCTPEYLAPSSCPPVVIHNEFGRLDYPNDERTLALAFLQNERINNVTQRRDIAEQWFNVHFDNFLAQSDLLALQQAGVTHVRVPLPHWILHKHQEMDTDEPWWIVGDRWKYFVRLCRWVREMKTIQVWPDVHTAPGSQNGFGT